MTGGDRWNVIRYRGGLVDDGPCQVDDMLCLADGGRCRVDGMLCLADGVPCRADDGPCWPGPWLLQPSF